MSLAEQASELGFAPHGDAVICLACLEERSEQYVYTSFEDCARHAANMHGAKVVMPEAIELEGDSAHAPKPAVEKKPKKKAPQKGKKGIAV